MPGRLSMVPQGGRADRNSGLNVKAAASLHPAAWCLCCEWRRMCRAVSELRPAVPKALAQWLRAVAESIGLVARYQVAVLTVVLEAGHKVRNGRVDRHEAVARYGFRILDSEARNAFRRHNILGAQAAQLLNAGTGVCGQLDNAC